MCSGFTFADLHEPKRLRDLYDAFTAEVNRTEPDLWQQWTQYREVPESLGPVAKSNLIVQMAPHVSRFMSRLFGVGAEAEALVAATAAYDDLFRFKIDFVRRRALPLLKGGAHVMATAEDHAYVASLVGGTLAAASAIPGTPEAELAIARAGCALLDRDEAARASGSEDEKAAVAAQIDVAEAVGGGPCASPRLSRLGGLPLPRDAGRRPPGPDSATRPGAARD